MLDFHILPVIVCLKQREYTKFKSKAPSSSVIALNILYALSHLSLLLHFGVDNTISPAKKLRLNHVKHFLKLTKIVHLKSQNTNLIFSFWITRSQLLNIDKIELLTMHETWKWMIDGGTMRWPARGECLPSSRQEGDMTERSWRRQKVGQEA